MAYYSSNKQVERSLTCNDPNAPFKSIQELYDCLMLSGWDQYTAYNMEQFKKQSQKCFSQCNVTVLLVKKYFGGDIIEYPKASDKKKMHFFNRITYNGQTVDIDLTSEQFDPPLNGYQSHNTNANKKLGKYTRHCRIAELNMGMKQEKSIKNFEFLEKALNDVKDYTYYHALLEAQKNKKIINKEGYANYQVQCEMTFRGKERCNHHQRMFNKVDISKHIYSIQNELIEKALIVSIIGDEVQEIFCIQGNEDEIHAEAYFVQNEKGESAVDFIGRWKDKGAKICNYHNHPMNIAAIPSDNDIYSLSYPHQHSNVQNEWGKAVEKYKKDLPDGFRYDDWGIVTPFDFFSFHQALANGSTIDSLLAQNENDDIEAKEGAIRFFK